MVSSVTLQSTLKQNSLCPGDGAANFICTSPDGHVVWNVSGVELEFVEQQEGERIMLANHVASLLRCTEEHGYSSVLNIVDGSATEVTTVSCYNENSTLENVLEMMQYYHRVAGMCFLTVEPPASLRIVLNHA